MSLALRADESAFKGVQRIARTRMRDAVRLLQQHGSALDDDRIHEIRKCFKEIRGVLRLARGLLGSRSYHRDNRALRDAGKPLSELRDSAVLIVTLDQLVSRSRGRLQRRDVAPLRQRLQRRQRALRRAVLGEHSCVPALIETLRATRGRAMNWTRHARGWAALAAGLLHVYSQALAAMQAAQARTGPVSDEALHEWRKRTKALRYSLEVVQRAQPRQLRAMAGGAHQLTSLLGTDHDLAVLRQLSRTRPYPGHASSDARLLALIDERRERLQRRAYALGHELLQQHVRRFVERISDDRSRIRPRG